MALQAAALGREFAHLEACAGEALDCAFEEYRYAKLMVSSRCFGIGAHGGEWWGRGIVAGCCVRGKFVRALTIAGEAGVFES